MKRVSFSLDESTTEDETKTSSPPPKKKSKRSSAGSSSIEDSWEKSLPPPREDLNTVYLLHDRELYAVRFSWDPEVYYKTRQPLKSINGSAAKEIEEVLFGENVSDVLRHRVKEWRKYKEKVNGSGWTDNIGKYYFANLLLILKDYLEPLDFDIMMTTSTLPSQEGFSEVGEVFEYEPGVVSSVPDVVVKYNDWYPVLVEIKDAGSSYAQAALKNFQSIYGLWKGCQKKCLGIVCEDGVTNLYYHEIRKHQTIMVSRGRFNFTNDEAVASFSERFVHYLKLVVDYV